MREGVRARKRETEGEKGREEQAEREGGRESESYYTTATTVYMIF